MKNHRCILAAALLPFAGISGIYGAEENGKFEKPIILPGMIHNIRFHSQVVLTGGTLGYAESSSFGTGAVPTSYGEIYIYGLILPQGNVWIGIVYPTNRTIPHRGVNYPCCALSSEMAQRINALKTP